MAGKKREEGRTVADFAAVYGFCPFPLWPSWLLRPLHWLLGKPSPYTLYVQLVLNIERIRLQRAIGVGEGPTALLSDVQVDELVNLLKQSTADKARAEGDR